LQALLKISADHLILIKMCFNSSAGSRAICFWELYLGYILSASYLSTLPALWQHFCFLLKPTDSFMVTVNTVPDCKAIPPNQGLWIEEHFLLRVRRKLVSARPQNQHVSLLPGSTPIRGRGPKTKWFIY
jgi:hypothetical protein